MIHEQSSPRSASRIPPRTELLIADTARSAYEKYTKSIQSASKVSKVSKISTTKSTLSIDKSIANRSHTRTALSSIRALLLNENSVALVKLLLI